MVDTSEMESKDKSALRSLIKQGYVERVRSNGMVLLSFTDKGYVAAREAERV
jgi:DNA-binding MarR family transcriptional regulator